MTGRAFPYDVGSGVELLLRLVSRVSQRPAALLRCALAWSPIAAAAAVGAVFWMVGHPYMPERPNGMMWPSDYWDYRLAVYQHYLVRVVFSTAAFTAVLAPTMQAADRLIKRLQR